MSTTSRPKIVCPSGGPLLQLVKQPVSSRLCGQACVAMIAKIWLKQSIAVFGHRHSTNFTDLARAMDKLGIPHGPRLRVCGRRSIASRCIVRMRWTIGPGRSHYVVFWDGQVLCPSQGLNPGYARDAELPDFRYTSFMEIDGRL